MLDQINRFGIGLIYRPYYEMNFKQWALVDTKRYLSIPWDRLLVLGELEELY